jgi:hypothetical protein
MNLDLLRQELPLRVVTVTFKKVNGDLRIMDCTTNLQFVPPSKWPKDKIELSEESKQKTFRVFDVKAQGWRSFHSDSVIEAV